MTSTTLEYRDGDVRLKGILVQPEKRRAGSAIVLFPDARGVGAHAIECASRLAALGYPTLVADLYGEGIQARDMTHAGELMRGLRADVDRWRARARASLDALSRQEGVDRSRLAALGYCFGGGTSGSAAPWPTSTFALMLAASAPMRSNARGGWLGSAIRRWSQTSMAKACWRAT